MKVENSLKLIGSFLFRWIGFPIEPQLMKVGNPNSESPVLLTCNFALTVKRVLKAIQGLNCYLLIAPSNGINVWCGACGDDFNTDSVLSIIKTSGIDNLVSHRSLTLPQLSAPGIDPIIIKEKVGWEVKFGPVYAIDIPEYIESNYHKSDNQSIVKFPISQKLEIGTMYFFTLFLLFSVIYWILATFLSILNIILYISSLFIFIGIIYGSLIILPSIQTKRGKLKIWIYEIIIIILILTFNLFIIKSLFILIWELLLSLFLTLIMAEDFHGLTPIYKSELGEKKWKQGKKKMRFLFEEYKLQPYGQIHIEREKCIGCRLCIEVCPRSVYLFNEENKKAILQFPSKCINCNACINRCLANCLSLKLP
ncbi:MAG: HgcAB-like fusion protein [Candidatus Heimdallarchaeota archaeon]